MTPKPIIPKSLLKELIDSDKSWFEKYQSNSGDPSGYYPKVKEFLEFCTGNNGKPISKLDRNDVDAYIATLKTYKAKSPTVNGRLSAISGFRDFLTTKYGTVFSEKFLSDLPGHEDTEENPTDIRALQLEQLSYIRKYNQRKGAPVKDEYIFELFFQLGIGKNDLIDRNFPNPVNAKISGLMRKVRKGEIQNGTITSYFTRVTKYLQDQGVYNKNRRNINSYDLTESHTAYFQKCPNCGRFFENVAEHWVLTKVKFDTSDYQDEYHIVCAQCKGALNEN